MSNEVWKDVVGWEGFYQVSDRGRVRSLDRYIETSRTKPYLVKGRVMKQKTSKQGYKVISFKNKDVTANPVVHRLVAIAFIPNPDNLPQVNHIDGNKSNNDFTNLEWCTAKENINHAFMLGLKPQGEDSPYAKIDELTAHKICDMLSKGIPNTEIARILGITKSTVSKIKSGKSWKSVSSSYNIPKKGKGISENIVVKICEMLSEGNTAIEVLSELQDYDQNLTLAKIYSIRKRQYYTEISKKYYWEYNSSKRGKSRD